MKLIMMSILSLCWISVFAAPPPGHPSTDQAARIMQLPDADKLPYRGKVKQAIDSNNYTYIQVEMDNKTMWLAAPKRTLEIGQPIAFPDGMTIQHFYSRKLKRTFDSILFVSSVEILPQQI